MSATLSHPPSPPRIAVQFKTYLLKSFHRNWLTVHEDLHRTQNAKSGLREMILLANGLFSFSFHGGLIRLIV